MTHRVGCYVKRIVGLVGRQVTDARQIGPQGHACQGCIYRATERHDGIAEHMQATNEESRLSQNNMSNEVMR